MARQISKNASNSKSYGFLWLITGVLIGLFIASLSFLKKHVTVEAPEAAAKALHQATATPINAAHKQVATKTAGTANGNTSDSEQYDFYTMLPKMQVSQQTNAPVNTTPPPAPTTKPLAEAEQNMLTPGATTKKVTTTATPAATNSTTSQPTTTNTISAAPTVAKAKPAQAVQESPTPISPNTSVPYLVNAGSFTSYDKADAQKAALLMNGIDNAKIESSQSNGSIKYRVILGPFPDKTVAEQQLANLQKNSFTGTLEKAN